MNRILLVALTLTNALYPSAKAQTNDFASHYSLPSTNAETALRMAPRILRSMPQALDADSVLVKVWAYVLLRMPNHASKLLETQRDAVDSLERTVFERDAANLLSSQRKEMADSLVSYMTLAGSSNRLFAAHLRNLQTVATGGLVTNEPASENLDLSFLSINPENKPIALLYVPRDATAEMCSKGAFEKLAVQDWVVAELRRQAAWQLVVVISNHTIKPGFMMKILANKTDLNAGMLFPSDELLNGNDDYRQIALENFILDALNVKH